MHKMRYEHEGLEMSNTQLFNTVSGVVEARDIRFDDRDSSLVITPNDHILSSKTGSLSSDWTVEQISEVLGFKPNYQDDPDKVEFSWGADIYDNVTGEFYKIAIWDYKDARWSTYGDADILQQLFPCNS